MKRKKQVKRKPTIWKITFPEVSPSDFNGYTTIRLHRSDPDAEVDIRQLQQDQFALSNRHGFYGADTNVGERIALIHSELSELLETYRDDPKAMCDKEIIVEEQLPRHIVRKLTCEEEEMADVLLRLLDLASFREVDIWTAAAAKHKYNTTRVHRQGRKF